MVQKLEVVMAQPLLNFPSGACEVVVHHGHLADSKQTDILKENLVSSQHEGVHKIACPSSEKEGSVSLLKLFLEGGVCYTCDKDLLPLSEGEEGDLGRRGAGGRQARLQGLQLGPDKFCVAAWWRA